MIIPHRHLIVLDEPKTSQRESEYKKRENSFFHILSYEISIFIFPTPCTSYTISSSCSATIIDICRSIKSYLGICIANKFITPKIFMAYSPTCSAIRHNRTEIIVFYFSILVDYAPSCISWYIHTSLVCFS